MIDSLGIIEKFTTAGVLVDSVANLFSSGWGLTYGAEHLWVSDPSKNMIYRTLVNSLPQAFALLSPPDSDLVLTDTVNLDWEDSYDPDSVLYCLYLSPDPTFIDTSTTVVVDSLEESEYTSVPSGSLQFFQGYSHVSYLAEEEKGKTEVEMDREDQSNVASGTSPGTSEDRIARASDACARRNLNADDGIELVPDTTYYWKIKAYDQRGAERWSNQTFSFYLLSCTCGDCNGDSKITVADATYIVSYIYRGSSAMICECDANLDGKITIADATYVVSFIYRGGPLPCEP